MSPNEQATLNRILEVLEGSDLQGEGLVHRLASVQHSVDTLGLGVAALENRLASCQAEHGIGQSPPSHTGSHAIVTRTDDEIAAVTIWKTGRWLARHWPGVVALVSAAAAAWAHVRFTMK